MTTHADDERQRAFYDNVVGLLIEKRGGKHYPDSKCFRGECWWCLKNHFDWKGLIPLVKMFWMEGPDVPKEWTRSAALLRFNAEELLDVLVGAFVGGDRCEVGRVPKYWTWNHAEAKVTRTDPGWYRTYKEISGFL